MKLLNLFILLFITVNLIDAQDCKAYIPYEEGTKLELTNFDKKGKVTGIVNQETTMVKQTGNATIYTVKQISTNEKGKEPSETEMTFKCIDNVFYIDMNQFMKEEQMEAYKDMEMEVEMDELEMPSDLSEGQKLKDGSITINFTGDTPMPFNFKVNVINRKVEGFEDITTEAGTFKCVKMSQDIVSKIGMTFTVNSVDWFAEGIGSVKNELYRKGKLMGSTQLTKITKP